MNDLAPASEESYRDEVVLRNGSVVGLRSIRPDEDEERLLALAQRCSDRTIYYRFFTPPPLPFDRERLEFLTHVDHDRRVALVAFLGEGSEERIIAVGRWDVLPDDPTSAEVAFLVEDEFQGTGLGTALLRHLAAMAPRHGITRFEADVLGDNRAMLTVFGRSGYRVTHEMDSGVYHIVFPVRPTPESLEAAAAHERDALAASLGAFLQPRRIAIVGAGRDERTVGGSMLRNVVRGGYAGSAYPVNERAEAVAGIPAYSSVADLPHDVDLVVIAVPVDAVADVVDDCGARGVKAVLVASSGFGEEGQQQLLARCRKHGMRLLGPGSMGVLNTDPRTSLRLVAGDVAVPPGVVGIAAQSGALGLGVLDYLRSLNLGVSQFVSLGSRPDVSSSDLLAYWEAQEATRVILLYLEEFGSPRRFVRLARRVAAGKPIAAVAVGAAAAHPAARALYRQAGVIHTHTLEELLDVAALVASQPVPRGRRVAIVSNSGGAARLAAQALGECGLALADLAPGTVELIGPLVVAGTAATNPVELPPAPEAEGSYETALALAARDEGVDAVLAIYAPVHRAGAERVAKAIVAASWRAPQVTFVANFLSARGVPELLRRGRIAVPSFLFPESAARALGHAADYGAWLSQPMGDPVRPEGFDADAARELLASAGEGPVPTGLARDLLGAMGVDLDRRPHGVPFVLSMRVDDVFGPVIGLGTGVELGAVGPDSYRITPLTDADASRLVRQALRHAGDRVDPDTLDLDALVDLLLRVSVLGVELEQVSCCELVPVLVGAPGEGLRVGRVKLVKAAHLPVAVDPAGGVA